VTVVADFAATFLCCNAAIASMKHGLKKEGFFWLLFTGFLLFLGINKQLDLQTWLTLFGRHLAEEEGWYAQRRAVQAAFVGLVAILGASGLAFLWRWGRRDVRHYRLALCGGVFLACFIVIRAASFHYVDKMLALQFSNVTVNCTLELGGIFCVAIAARGIGARREIAHRRRSQRLRACFENHFIVAADVRRL